MKRMSPCVLVLIAVVLSAASASAEEPLVFIQAGELPIILSAPHGGQLPIPDVDEREQNGRPTGGAGFVKARDSNTEELARQVAKAIEERFGRKPFAVIARTHRKFLDPNRPASLAYDDPDAKPVYETYHKGLAEACQKVQNEFKRGLLLDIHGQGTAADTVFRGTQNGKTVKLLAERYGDDAVHGGTSLFGRLKSRGWKVHPDPFDGKEQAGFTGGYIVQSYGSHQAVGVDAVQLEFGAEYRTKDHREKVAKELTAAVADYAKDFLGVEPKSSDSK
jgi:N-formylglutamate amidohydrolase